MRRVLDKSRLFSAEEVVHLALPVRMSFEALRTGRGTPADYQELALAINTSLVRAMAIDPTAATAVGRAAAALTRCVERYTRTGKFGFDGPGIGDIAEAIDFHDQLLQNSTPELMLNAGLIAIKGHP